jgi:thiamine-phosphate pyrophosphorylase
MCRSAGVPLVLNDRVHLAREPSGTPRCDLVHVGQGDLPVAEARVRLALAGTANIGVGVSTHGADELARALAARPDYVAYGPVFATVSKEGAEPVVGVEGLARAARETRAAGLPLVAIGGITVARAAEVALHADAAAVIAGLFDGASGPVDLAAAAARARGYQESFGVRAA